MTNEQYLAALVLALDWPPIGENPSTVDRQIEVIKLIRHNAIGYGELALLFSQVQQHNQELAQENENLRLAIADARAILERIRL